MMLDEDDWLLVEGRGKTGDEPVAVSHNCWGATVARLQTNTAQNVGQEVLRKTLEQCLVFLPERPGRDFLAVEAGKQHCCLRPRIHAAGPMDHSYYY